MLALDPPHDGARSAAWWPRATRARPPSLRRAARPPARRASRCPTAACRGRRQGDQERGRLRPRQALDRRLRDARGVRRGVVRLHPLAGRDAGRGDRRGRTPRARRRARARAARRSSALARRALGRARGGARALAGVAARARAEARGGLLGAAGLEAETREDDALWARQREGQRSPTGPWVRVSTRRSRARRRSPRPRLGASAVGRAGLGSVWLALAGRRGSAAESSCGLTVSPCAASTPAGWDGAGGADPQRAARPGAERFDPAASCAR